MTWKNKEKEQCKENGNGVPFLTNGIGTRISDSSRAVGGKKKLAEMIGMSESQLHRVISGESQLKVEGLAAIAQATQQSIAWLAIGRQSNMVAESGAAYQSGKMIVNTELLQEVLETVETVLQERGCELKPDKKSELISIIYEEFSQEEGEPDTNKIVRLINLAS